MLPVVVAGGSFNNSSHRTQIKAVDRALIDALIEEADPQKVFFVVGHSLSGQEGYLVRRASGRFRIFAIVPGRISAAERARLVSSGVEVLISIENSAMGLYKSFAYEIFKRVPSVLLALTAIPLRSTSSRRLGTGGRNARSSSARAPADLRRRQKCWKATSDR